MRGAYVAENRTFSNPPMTPFHTPRSRRRGLTAGPGWGSSIAVTLPDARGAPTPSDHLKEKKQKSVTDYRVAITQIKTTSQVPGALERWRGVYL